jgi:hypothetical protein
MRIGITGHQELGDPAAWPWVATMMRQQLTGISPPLVGVTSLAVGTDQLFARAILELGGSLFAVLPFADIERSFSREQVAAFRELAGAATVEVLATSGTDEEAYFAAGQRVVDLSDLLLAVWDGAPAKGRGGTGDIVAYATLRRIPLVHINPISRCVRRPHARD